MEVDISNKFSCATNVWLKAVYAPKNRMVSITLTGTGSFPNGSIVVLCNDPIYNCEQTGVHGGACGNANKTDGTSANIYSFTVTDYNRFTITYMQAITADLIGVHFMYKVR